MFRRIAFISISTAAYGFILGWWRSLEMAGYVAIKLPIVFVGSTLVVSVFSWMAGLLCGSGLRYREMMNLVFAAMSSASQILLALVPVVFFFIVTGAPETGTRDEMRFAHSVLLSTHIVVFAAAGVIGNLKLRSSLKSRAPVAGKLPLLLATWLGAFAFVGCQVGWMMRPLVGSPNIRVEFLRADALDGNFLESVFQQVIPHLIHKGAL